MGGVWVPLWCPGSVLWLLGVVRADPGEARGGIFGQRKKGRHCRPDTNTEVGSADRFRTFTRQPGGQFGSWGWPRASRGRPGEASRRHVGDGVVGDGVGDVGDGVVGDGVGGVGDSVVGDGVGNVGDGVVGDGVGDFGDGVVGDGVGEVGDGVVGEN